MDGRRRSSENSSEKRGRNRGCSRSVTIGRVGVRFGQHIIQVPSQTFSQPSKLFTSASGTRTQTKRTELIMKTSELIISITAVLLIALTIGDGSPAPKWRPQGRFGKRVSEINDDPLWVLLSSENEKRDELLPYSVANKPVHFENLLCIPVGVKNAYRCTRSES